MMPSAFVVLDKLPLTPNGKVDRKALPERERKRLDLERSFIAPRTPCEKALAETWREILGVDRVGVHDDFFDLGGHSLLATRVMSQLRESFQVEIPLRDLFENPTVAGLAAKIEARAREITDILADVEALTDEEAGSLVAQREGEKI